MLTVLASGTLAADPKRRTSTNGRTYATALLRVPVEDGEPTLLSIITFSDSAVTALLVLTKGDAVAVTGRGKLSSWTAQNGEERHGLSVLVEQVMTPYLMQKKRKQAAGTQSEAEI